MRRLLIPLLLAVCAAPASAANVQGQVIDQATQQPLAGARVSVIYGPGLVVSEYRYALTDLQGHFDIPLPTDFQGQILLVAAATGHAARNQAGDPCRDTVGCYYHSPLLTLTPASVLTQNFQLPAEARISGRVIDQASGAGLADGHVWLRPANGLSSFLAGDAMTDADGYFSIAAMHAGSYTLDASVYPQATAPMTPYLAFGWPDNYCDNVQLSCDETTPTPIALSAGTHLDGTTVPMRQGSFLRARLRSSGNSQPVYMAAIAYRPDRLDNGWAGSPGADNYSVLGPLLPGTLKLLLTTSLQSYPSLVYPDQPCYADPCDLSTAPTIEIPSTPTTVTLPDLFVAPRRTIRGHVTDASTGQPVRGLRVAAGTVTTPLILGGWGFQTSATAVTDDNGEYRLEGFNGATTMVRTDQAGRGYVDRAWQNLACSSANLFCHDERVSYDRLGFGTEPHPQNIDFALQRSGGIRGRVLQRGQPLANFAVSVIPASNRRLSKPVFTDAEGQYLFDGLDTGEYFLYAGPSVQVANNNGTVFPGLPCSVGFIGSEPSCDLTQASPFTVQQGYVIDGVDLIVPLPDALFSDTFEL